jgi:hypothetical protein
MNGYGGDNRVYGVGRNTYRYPRTWKADLRLAKHFNLGSMRQLELLTESFNLFNHQNVTELETVGYSIESGSVNESFPTLNFLTGLKTGQTEFGLSSAANSAWDQITILARSRYFARDSGGLDSIQLKARSAVDVGYVSADLRCLQFCQYLLTRMMISIVQPARNHSPLRHNPR